MIKLLIIVTVIEDAIFALLQNITGKNDDRSKNWVFYPKKKVKLLVSKYGCIIKAIDSELPHTGKLLKKLL